MMRRRPRPVSIGIACGEAIALGTVTLVPRAWTLTVHLGPVRMAWMGPLDVTVWDDTRRRRLMVPDITRALQVLLLGAALVSVMLWGRGHPRGRGEDHGR
jgi:hypothetical protein